VKHFEVVMNKQLGRHISSPPTFTTVVSSRKSSWPNDID